MEAAGETFALPQRHRIAGVRVGAMRSVRRGAGSDVAGSRPYVPGDDRRTIDRHASARLSSVRSSDEWIVRQNYADEATRVVVAADRRPSMGLFPPELPWLRKPRALAAVARLVRRSAAAAACLTGYAELCEDGEPVWLSPGRTRPDDLDRAVAAGSFRAPRDALDRTLAHLALRARLPSGSFVFLVSDFLSFPADDVLAEAVGRRWRLVPVVVQDPLWERSFPDVAGTLLPVADPESGRVRCVRLTRREVRARRRLHEARWDEALERFEGLGLDPVVVDSHEALPILESFREWADRAGAGGGRL